MSATVYHGRFLGRGVCRPCDPMQTSSECGGTSRLVRDAKVAHFCGTWPAKDALPRATNDRREELRPAERRVQRVHHVEPRCLEWRPLLELP